ncbi:GIY-YIG nuclease family protein [Bacillus megaterium]|nr:GIY-YIG nuclease family protein [Priestia megaterium]
MGKELLKAGIYAIINKRLKMVYIGITQDCFLVRWIEHLKRMPMYLHNNDRTRLYLAKDTQYIVLKEIDVAISDKKMFYELEIKAQEFYKERGWIVLSTSTYNKATEYSPWNFTIEAKKKRYRRAISHMVATIGKEINQSEVVARLYTAHHNEVNRSFDTYMCNKPRQTPIEELGATELQLIMLDLYPRYKVKSTNKMREQYIQTDRQLDLFT